MRARVWRRMNPTSRARSVGVIGETIAPQRHAAQHNTTASHQLGSCIAITSPGRTSSCPSAAAVRADCERSSPTVTRRSPSTIASRVPSAPASRSSSVSSVHAPCARHRACTSAGAGCGEVIAAPYTGAGGGALASNSRTAGPTALGSHRAPRSTLRSCCQPSAIEIMPPSTSNTRPVTSAASALPSHTTSGEMLAGSFASKPASGACMRSANTASVIRVRAAGAIAFAVTP